MPKYMLLLSDDPSEYADYSPTDFQDLIARYNAWSDDLAARGKLRGGEKLRDEGGKTIRSEGGKVVVRDGPYAEVREVVSGYFIIEAADYEEAVAIAVTCPHAQTRSGMMVREIDPVT